MKLFSPQKVISDEGFTVQVADRYTIEYVESTSHWVVEVDFGVNSTGLYRSTLKLDKGIAKSDENIVFDRIVKALSLMESNCEILS